ncbi:hypothetical protein EC919_104185 [Pseudomonas graminis]|uniref:hypothetical protein n=1 Tax=Pseudomonas graminis TaxID=158627 RepID=UPI00105B9889|nr:hypothetical protein [Pseudomonas graminis]TDV54449.1 hypothetical protein EC919_104185 [Pseudomonas graminis]
MKRIELNYVAAWAKAVDDNDATARKTVSYSESSDSRLMRIAFGSYKLECFLERICVKYSTPWLNLSSLEAGRLYLLNKHHWTLEVLKMVEKNDLIALLHEELAELSLTREEFQPVHDWGMHQSCYPELLASANLPK